MKIPTFLTILLSVATAALAKNVVELSDADFHAHVAKNKYVLAEFYAPWCGHCKALKQPYEDAATALKDVEVEGGLSVVAVDATKSEKLAKEFEVSGFPTLKWFDNGKVSDYKGGRTAETITSWVKKRVGPAADPVSSEEELNKLKTGASVFVFGYFKDQASVAAKSYLEAAASFDDIKFGISSTYDAGLDDGSVVVYRNFEDEEPTVNCGAGDLEACISRNSLPAVAHFSPETAQKIFSTADVSHVLIFAKGSDISAKLKKDIREVALKHRPQYMFTTVDEKEDRLKDFFDVKNDQLPTVRIVELTGAQAKKFIFEEKELNKDTLEAFVKKHESGTLDLHLKSEKEIDDASQPDKDGVWVLVGTSHDKVALNPEKNVLVEYYAPWCGHCKKLAPEYKKVAEHFKDDDSVLIAKMDAAANEVESVSITGFPTLKFYPAGSKEVVEVGSLREAKPIIDFVDSKKK